MYIFSFVQTDFRCRCTLYPTYVNGENKTGMLYLSNVTCLIHTLQSYAALESINFEIESLRNII